MLNKGAIMNKIKQSGQSLTKARLIKAIQIQGNSKIVQQQAILTWFRNIKPSLTTMEARDELSTLHPAGRILELRRQGYDIPLTWTNSIDENGVSHRIGVYHYFGKKGVR